MSKINKLKIGNNLYKKFTNKININKAIIIILLILLVIVIVAFSRISVSSSTNVDSKKDISILDFTRVETDIYIDNYFKKIGDTNKYFHYREFTKDNIIIRLNNDTLYSIAIIDLSYGDVEIILPDTNNRYMSCSIIDQNHYSPIVIKAPNRINLKPSDFNTRYLISVIRTFVKENNKNELKIINNLQNKIKIISNQKGKGEFKMPNYDMIKFNKMRMLVKNMFYTIKNLDTIDMFGSKEEVNDIKHLLGTYMGWGGLNQKYAFYKDFNVDNNNGTTEYTINVKDVPVREFWSITVYDKEGFLFNNVKRNSINNFLAKKNKDGSITINFSNDENKSNNINIKNGWSYIVRMYEPENVILNGTWVFPKAQIKTISF